MPPQPDLGPRIRSYRLRRGLSPDELGQRLGLAKPRAYLSKLERGRIERPHRRRLLEIAWHLGLNVDETNFLLGLARHHPLDIHERHDWQPSYFPGHLAAWRDLLQSALRQNRNGALRDAQRDAERLLDQIRRTEAQDTLPLDMWSRDERHQVARIGIAGFAEYFYALALTHPAEDLPERVEPWLALTRRLAADLGEPDQTALVDYTEADYIHCCATTRHDHGRSLDLARRARDHLRLEPFRHFNQRLIIIGSLYWWRSGLEEEIERGWAAVAEPVVSPGEDIRGRTHLLDGIALAYSTRGDRRCETALRQTVEATWGADHVGTVMSMRTAMCWRSVQSGGRDLAGIRRCGEAALDVSTALGLERHAQQVRNLARREGITLTGAFDHLLDRAPR